MPPTAKFEYLDVSGEKSDYWFRYDNLAESKDQVIIERLNSGLDALLIFVSGLSPFASEVGEVRRLVSSEQRLSVDPLVQVVTLQAELAAYAIQLLWCLYSLLPGDSRISDTRFTLEEAETLVDIVAKLQAGFATDADVVDTLKVIDFVVLE
ncbi:hypothetical protein FRB94_008019 [Tulasnella sp. JGI-2019a]|nr:hypothetical protein FRB94_008019 [Tulasnella sp. JGI-2019a]